MLSAYKSLECFKYLTESIVFSQYSWNYLLFGVRLILNNGLRLTFWKHACVLRLHPSPNCRQFLHVSYLQPKEGLVHFPHSVMLTLLIKMSFALENIP